MSHAGIENVQHVINTYKAYSDSAVFRRTLLAEQGKLVLIRKLS